MNSTDYPNDCREKATALVRSRKTMTLATTEGERPWAAPVYYVFTGGIFYFFSDPHTRHIRETEQTGRAAAAIFDDEGEGWRQLRGIQLTGRVSHVATGSIAVTALTAYMRKFGFVASLIPKEMITDLNFFENRFRARLYGLAPEKVYYMDNAVRFGFRIEVKLS